jgi:Flp pilus assembly protein TadD
VYYKRGILPLATTTLEEAVQLDPNAALYSYHLGLVHAKAGEDAKARKALERAIQLDSKSAFAADARKTLATLVY